MKDVNKSAVSRKRRSDTRRTPSWTQKRRNTQSLGVGSLTRPNRHCSYVKLKFKFGLSRESTPRSMSRITHPPGACTQRWDGTDHSQVPSGIGTTREQNRKSRGGSGETYVWTVTPIPKTPYLRRQQRSSCKRTPTKNPVPGDLGQHSIKRFESTWITSFLPFVCVRRPVWNVVTESPSGYPYPRSWVKRRTTGSTTRPSYQTNRDTG